jgi:hypothetical protein
MAGAGVGTAGAGCIRGVGGKGAGFGGIESLELG